MNSSRRVSRGGGRPPDDKDDKFNLLMWILGVLAAIVFFLIFAILMSDNKVKTYQVNGMLVGYVNKMQGKAYHTHVNVLQSDGKVRQYNTYIHPEQCKRHVAGINVVVKVDVYQNWFMKDRTYTHSQLVTNPCF